MTPNALRFWLRPICSLPTQYQTADAIVSEAVSQSASSAQGLYLAKTTSYQTADAIVNEAVRQAATSASGAYIAKTSTYQTADSIKTEAVRVSGANAAALYLEKNSSYPTVDAIINQANAAADAAADTAKNASIAKTETYQSAQAIVNTAVAAAATAAGQSYIAKTTQYQTADAIVSAAEGYVDGELVNYSTTTQTNTLISQYVGNHAYGLVSGIAITAAGIDISGSQYVAIASGGYFKVTTGDFGIDTSQSGICMWAGAAAAGSAAFRVSKNGTVYLTKLVAVGEDGTESDVNLRTANLWKLNYGTVKSLTVSGGYCTGMTFSNSVSGYSSVNFKSAATARAEGWTAAYNKVSWPGYNVSSDSMTVKAPSATETTTGGQQETTYKVTVSNSYASIEIGATGIAVARVSNPAYGNGKSDGWTAAYNKVSWPGYNVSSDSMTVKAPSATETTTGGQQETTYKVSADNEYATIEIGSSGIVVARVANPAYAAGASAEWAAAYSQCYCVRDGAVISAKIPSVTQDQYSTYSYTISTSYSWENPTHIKINALINGIIVSSQTVRANQPV